MDVLADVLAAMRTGGSVSARAEMRAPWGLRFPATEGAAFHVVLRGTCWLVTPNGPEGAEGAARPAAEPLALAPGDVLLLRDGRAHGLAHDPAGALTKFAPARQEPSAPIGHLEIDGPGPRAVLLCGAYQLSRSRVHPLMRALPEILHLPGRHGALHSITELLGAELDERRPGRDGIVPALVDAMLPYVLRAWASGRQEPAGWAAALTDPAVGRALEAIHAEPARTWTVEDLGACGGLSRSVFAQRFTALVGSSPLAYLTWWRMTIAGRLLRDSDAPLGTVARRVGYRSEFAFAKAFKREYGTAPGRYRREHAGRGTPRPAT
ncbi:AraC family transcriptional regulator [Streptomyces sp. MP131-18]|uniref:AraC family transcriptional regulator n=1 Tax=Streptomyces sp. MP131-18 TaxID=1857892 RepID=UPI00097C12AE|nr:AraC family transcriptional regulator [Streptomyces sp. MP131-18]ONK12304.1 Bacillibactin transport regulator [Streptomyces sp. MP131-18]